MDNHACEICGATATIHVTNAGLSPGSSEVHRCEKHPPTHIIDELMISIAASAKAKCSSVSSESVEQTIKRAEETIAKWRNRKDAR